MSQGKEDQRLEGQNPGGELPETVSSQVDEFLDDPEGLGTRRERPAYQAGVGVKSPHEQAMDRHEAAVRSARETAVRAAEAVTAADREVCDSLEELNRYEKKPGVPLPVGDQYRIQGLMAAARRRMGERRDGEDR